MEYEWPKKTKSLETLTNSIEGFLRKKDFSVRIVQVTDKIDTTRILAIPTMRTEIRETIKIEVRKTSEGIAISFAAADRAEDMVKLGILSQILVGGALLRKGVNTKEKAQALEADFWAYTQEIIASLDS